MKAAYWLLAGLIAGLCFATLAEAQPGLPPLPAAGLAPASDTLTEAAAVREALRASPEARAAEARLEVARADRTVATRLLVAPPVIEANTQLGTDFRREADDHSTEVSVSQAIELPGALLARRRAGARTFEAAEAGRETERQGLIAEVRSAVATLAARQAELQVATAIARASDTLMAATELRFREGDVSELERNIASVEAARTAGEAAEATLALVAAQAELNRLLGRPADQPIAVEPLPSLIPTAPGSAPGADPDRTPSAVDALARRPEARAADLSAQAAGFTRRLARQGLVTPGIELRLGVEQSTLFYGRDDLRGSPALVDSFDRLGRSGRDVMLGVSLALPFGGSARGEARRAEAELRLREAERDAVQGRITAEVTAATARLTQAEIALNRFAQVAPRLDDNLVLLGQAYAGGEIDLSALLVERDRLYRAQLGLITARFNARQARIALDRALGLVPVPFDDQTMQP